MLANLEEVEFLIEEKLIAQEAKFKVRLEEQERRYKHRIYELENKLNKKFNTRIKKLKSTSNQFSRKNDELSHRIETLETDIVELSKELEETSRVAYSTDQYIRRNNIELSGIPHQFDNNLDEVCISLINSILEEPGKPGGDECDISIHDIEGCHRLPTKNKDGTKNTIVRFTNRKICEDVLINKRRLKDIKNDELGNTVKKIYVNENLSHYYKQLAAKSRRLKKNIAIIDTWTINGIVKIKLNNESIKSLTHQNDLDVLFPNYDYFGEVN